MAAPGAEQLHPEDWQSPETLTEAVHSLVSGPAGEVRDWVRYRALFQSGARLASIDSPDDRPARLIDVGIDGYVAYFAPAFEERGIYED